MSPEWFCKCGANGSLSDSINHSCRQDPYLVGMVPIECSACPEVIEVPVTATLNGDSNQQGLDLDADMTDLWAHSWTHGGVA